MKVLKNRVVMLVVVGIVVAIVLTAILVVSSGSGNKVDTTYISTQLEKASELITAKLHFTGMSEFQDEGTKFINKSDFTMVYEATANAGIDVKNVKIGADEENRVINITIPKATVISVKVNPASIRYFDEKFALFNNNQKEDSNKAIALAEEEAKKEVARMGVLEMADQQAEALIKGLVQDSIPRDYTIKIKRI